MSGKQSRILREKFENESGFMKEDRDKMIYKDLYKKFKRKQISIKKRIKA